jgi:hypothetical protein
VVRETMPDETMKMPSFWSIGRIDKKGKFVHAFDVKHVQGGGIKLFNVTRLSDAEKLIIFSHFGSPHKGMTGDETKDGTMVEILNVTKPGTEEGFLRSVYSLPYPFEWMSPAETL